MHRLQQLELLAMNFPNRLCALRKEHNMTQQTLADKASIHVAQIRRYESGETQPALDVIRKLAIALHVSADMLVFDPSEREPDDDFRLQFEAISRFEDDDKKVIKALLEGMILKYETKRISKMSN